MGITDFVQRGDFLFHETSRLGKQVTHDRRISINESGQGHQAIKPTDAVENKINISKRRSVIGHATTLEGDLQAPVSERQEIGEAAVTCVGVIRNVASGTMSAMARPSA